MSKISDEARSMWESLRKRSDFVSWLTAHEWRYRIVDEGDSLLRVVREHCGDDVTAVMFPVGDDNWYAVYHPSGYFKQIVCA